MQQMPHMQLGNSAYGAPHQNMFGPGGGPSDEDFSAMLPDPGNPSFQY